MIQRITVASKLVPTPQQIFPACTSPSNPVSAADSPVSWGINLLISTTTPNLASESSQENVQSSALGTVPDYIFFGVSSHLASISSILAPLAEYTPATFGCESNPRTNPASSTSAFQVGCPDFSTASRLFAIFYRSVHVWYPVMNDNASQKLLSSCHKDDLSLSMNPSQELFYLILAISSQLAKRAEPQVGFTPAAYFDKATSNIDTSCEHSSGFQALHMMQRSLLICIYLLLSPGQGDIWRNLGFAIRLYFDMSHGRFENLDSLDESHLAMLARTLYCIEGYVLTPKLSTGLMTRAAK